MSLDHLLLWLSVKNAGSWPQFRAAVEELHVQRLGCAPNDTEADGEGSSSIDNDLPVYQEVRFSMQRLGHVEFQNTERGYVWRVVPPTVAFLSGKDACGLLCGARSSPLIERLGQLHDVEVLVSQVEGMPQRIIIRGVSQETMAKQIQILGFHVQEAAPIALLSALPVVRNPITWHAAPMPETPGWSIHRFSPARLRWASVSPAEATKAATGLFRFVMKHQRFYYLRWRGRSYKVPVQVGKYAVMGRRHDLLTYEPEHGILSVPAVCRPPLLIERALVLCSGVLPRFDPSSGRVEYAQVPPDVVRLAAQLLCQEVR